MDKQFNAEIRIGRCEGDLEIDGSTHSRFMQIEIRDKGARLTVARVSMTMEAFAEALSGLAWQGSHPATTEANDPRIGSRKVTKSVKVDVADQGYVRDFYEEGLANNVFYTPPEGWFVSPYLGSQGSVRHYTDDDSGEKMVRLNFSIYTWVRDNG